MCIMVHMSQSPTTPAPPPADPNLLCYKCRYNLHTLDPAARCPECGLPVAASRRAHDLGGMNLAALARGMALLAAAAAWPLFVAIFRARLSVLTRPWAYLAVDF